MWNTWYTVCARHMPHMAALSYIRTDVSLVVKRMHTHIYTHHHMVVFPCSPHIYCTNTVPSSDFKHTSFFTSTLAIH